MIVGSRLDFLMVVKIRMVCGGGFFRIFSRVLLVEVFMFLVLVRIIM